MTETREFTRPDGTPGVMPARTAAVLDGVPYRVRGIDLYWSKALQAWVTIPEEDA